MTLPKERQASNRIEKEQLIQDIRKINPDIPKQQLERYDIDDLQKIKMANTPQPNVGNTAGRPKMQQGGKMKKGYKEGKTVSDNDILFVSHNQRTMYRYNDYKKDPVAYEKKYGKGSGSAIEKEANKLITNPKTGEQKPLKEIAEGNKKGGRIKYQQGGMADMSAAPMVQPKKKKTQSGFRSKYSKGGGVRTAKYKI